MIEVLLAACLISGGDNETWPMNVETSGEDMFWQSPGSIRPDAVDYGCSIVVSGAWATVEYWGLEFGPFDVGDQIPGEVYVDSTEGPCPTSFGTEVFVTPDPPEPVTLAFNIRTDLLEQGQCEVFIDEVTLGTAEYDLGWPFGTVTVQLIHMSFESHVSVTAEGTACEGDIDGSGEVDVTDILGLLAAWGPCSGDCPADLNEDGDVNVTDLLGMLAAWGPCA